MASSSSATSNYGAGVAGFANGQYSPGVLGHNDHDSGRGVMGRATGDYGYGVWGEALGELGRYGGYFQASATTTTAYGLLSYAPGSGISGTNNVRGLYALVSGQNARGLFASTSGNRTDVSDTLAGAKAE